MCAEVGTWQTTHHTIESYQHTSISYHAVVSIHKIEQEVVQIFVCMLLDSTSIIC